MTVRAQLTDPLGKSNSLWVKVKVNKQIIQPQSSFKSVDHLLLIELKLYHFLIMSLVPDYDDSSNSSSKASYSDDNITR